MTLPTNCAGYWKLDETSGNAMDSSGLLQTLVNTNVTYAAGKLNNCAVVPSNGYLKDSDICDLGTGDFAIACWFKTTSGADTPLVAKKQTLATSWSWMIRNATKKLCWTNDETGAIIIKSNDVVNTGAWIHAVVTRISGVDYQYINGTLQTETAIDTKNWNTTANFVVGGSDEPRYFNGSMDNVVIVIGSGWNQALVNVDYNGGAGIDYTYVAPAAAAVTLGGGWMESEDKVKVVISEPAKERKAEIVALENHIKTNKNLYG